MNQNNDCWTATEIELPKPLFNLRSVPTTTVADYVRLRHVKDLYAQAWKGVPKNGRGTPLELAAWMQALGRRNRSKFLRKLRGPYPRLDVPLPLRLLALLGITLEDLHSALALDQEEYERALLLADKPRCFQYRFFACMYPVVGLPCGLDEAGAIAHVQRYMKENRPGDNWPANIGYRDVKRIWIRPDSFYVEYYRPGFKVGREAVAFTNDGRDVGMVTIK
jgi:hypothetical protein